jgi:cytochrome c oxidase assembly protein subunit 15
MMAAHHRLIWFRRLSLVAAGLAFCVVVLGAWVRLTDAGLGCPDWPGCYGHVFPHADVGVHFGKALHEMIHRYFALSLGLIISTLLIWAVVNRHDSEQPLIPVAILFVLVCFQGVLGAFTVTLLLKPLIVTAHLLGGLSTLSLLAWLALWPLRGDLSNSEKPLRLWALCGAAVLLIQLSLGGWTSTNYAAVACPDFPTCQGSWWPHMDFSDAFVLWRGLGIDFEGGVLAHPARVAIHFTHRLGALLTGSVLISLGVVTAVRAKTMRLEIAGMLLCFAVALQIAIGIATVHWALPLALATLHNAGAAFVVLCMVNLVRCLWPTSRVGMMGS